MADYITPYTVSPNYDYLAGYDKDFDNAPVGKDTSRTEGVLNVVGLGISTVGDVLTSFFNSKRPGATYYVTQPKDTSSNTFLIVAVAAVALILIVKKKK